MSTSASLQEKQIRMAEELLFSGKRLPSFVKALYFGVFDAQRVFPYPKVSAQEQTRVDDFLVKLNEFCDAHLDPAWIDRNAQIPRSVIDGLAKLGVLGCTIAPEHGGLGITQYGYCKMVETVARRCASTALFINVHQSIGLKALLLFGTDEQRRRWLPPLARGEYLAAFALTEPNAGSDAAGVQTRAVYDPDRNVYRITGEKQWITNGSIAQVLTVMAQTTVDTPEGPQDKITAFLVTPDMPGFKVTAAALEKVSTRGTVTSKLAFENMEVPAANILGPLGGGLKVALTVLDFGRTTFGANCTGVAKELLERGIEHAKTRHQFGRPLASFALVKKKIATMAALAYAMDATTYLTAGLLDRGEEDFMLETAILKVFTSEALWSIVYDTMQIFGGRAFFTDAPYERIMRDARLNMIGEGSNDVLRAFIGVVGLRDPGMRLKDIKDSVRSPLAGAASLLGFGKDNLSRLLGRPEVPVQSSRLAEDARRLSDAVKQFGFTITRALVRYREAIIERQMVLDRIATAAIAIHTASAVVSKLDSELSGSNGKSEAVEKNLAAGKLYCAQAFDAIQKALAAVLDNDDATIEAVSDRITGM